MAGQHAVVQQGRYLQYRVVFNTSNAGLSPRLFSSADNTVTQQEICRLLSVCAALTGAS